MSEQTTYQVKTYRVEWTGAGNMTRTVVNPKTVEVVGRDALRRELDSNGVPGAKQTSETGRDEAGGYVTEWAPVETAATETAPAAKTSKTRKLSATMIEALGSAFTGTVPGRLDYDVAKVSTRVALKDRGMSTASVWGDAAETKRGNWITPEGVAAYRAARPETYAQYVNAAHAEALAEDAERTAAATEDAERVEASGNGAALPAWVEALPEPTEDVEVRAFVRDDVRDDGDPGFEAVRIQRSGDEITTRWYCDGEHVSTEEMPPRPTCEEASEFFARRVAEMAGEGWRELDTTDEDDMNTFVMGYRPAPSTPKPVVCGEECKGYGRRCDLPQGHAGNHSSVTYSAEGTRLGTVEWGQDIDLTSPVDQVAAMYRERINDTSEAVMIERRGRQVARSFFSGGLLVGALVDVMESEALAVEKFDLRLRAYRASGLREIDLSQRTMRDTMLDVLGRRFAAAAAHMGYADPVIEWRDIVDEDDSDRRAALAFEAAVVAANRRVGAAHNNLGNPAWYRVAVDTYRELTTPSLARTAARLERLGRPIGWNNVRRSPFVNCQTAADLRHNAASHASSARVYAVAGRYREAGAMLEGVGAARRMAVRPTYRNRIGDVAEAYDAARAEYLAREWYGICGADPAGANRAALDADWSGAETFGEEWHRIAIGSYHGLIADPEEAHREAIEEDRERHGAESSPGWTITKGDR